MCVIADEMLSSVDSKVYVIADEMLSSVDMILCSGSKFLSNDLILQLH